MIDVKWHAIKAQIEKYSELMGVFSSNLYFSNPADLIDDICLKNNWGIEEISVKKRDPNIVFKRALCCSLASVYAMVMNHNCGKEKLFGEWSLNSIGSIFGKDHAMVLHYKNSIANMIETNYNCDIINEISYRYGVSLEDFVKYKRITKQL